MSVSLTAQNMSMEEKRRLYVLAPTGRLKGRTAATLNNRDLKWAISYNQRTIDWIRNPRQVWRHEQRDGDEDRRIGRTARQVWPKDRKRQYVLNGCLFTLSILLEEQRYRIDRLDSQQSLQLQQVVLAPPPPPAPRARPTPPAIPPQWEMELPKREVVREPEQPDWKASLAERLDWTTAELFSIVGTIRKRLEETEEELAEVITRAEGLDALAAQLRRMK
jgi:hypothetical protein